MGGGVDAASQTAHGGPSGAGQGVAEGGGEIEAIPGAPPGADDCYCRRRSGLPDYVQLRRVLQIE